MVKGALRRNKKKRKGSFPSLASRVKLLTEDEFFFEKVHSLISTGCVVQLENFRGNERVIAYKTNSEKNSVCIAYFGYHEDYIHTGECTFDGKRSLNYNFNKTSLVLTPSWKGDYEILKEKLQVLKIA